MGMHKRILGEHRNNRHQAKRSVYCQEPKIPAKKPAGGGSVTHGLPFEGFEVFWSRHTRECESVAACYNLEKSDVFNRVKSNNQHWYNFKNLVHFVERAYSRQELAAEDLFPEHLRTILTLAMIQIGQKPPLKESELDFVIERVKKHIRETI